MATYQPQTRTKVLDTATIATLEDALYEYDIPQAYRNALYCQLFLMNAKEPGLEIQGQSLNLPGVRPERITMGGTRAEVFVNFEIGATAQSFTGTDILETKLADGPTVAFQDYAFYTCSVGIPLTTKLKNTGDMKRLDILRSRQNQEIRQMTRLMETALHSTNGDTAEGTQNDFAGMAHKIIIDPTSSTTVQGLPQDTFTPWRNQTKVTVAFSAAGLDEMRSMWFNVSGTNGHEPPHLIVTTSTVAGFTIKSLEGVHRLVGNLKDSDLSSENLPTFMGVPIIHTDDCAAGTMYYLNFDYLCSVVHEGADWSEFIPGRANDQLIEDEKRYVFGASPLMLKRREKFGQISSITA